MLRTRDLPAPSSAPPNLLAVVPSASPLALAVPASAPAPTRAPAQIPALDLMRQAALGLLPGVASSVRRPCAGAQCARALDAPTRSAVLQRDVLRARAPQSVRSVQCMPLRVRGELMGAEHRLVARNSSRRYPVLDSRDGIPVLQRQSLPVVRKSGKEKQRPVSEFSGYLHAGSRQRWSAITQRHLPL